MTITFALLQPLSELELCSPNVHIAISQFVRLII
jgi:hypothetical protein